MPRFSGAWVFTGLLLDVALASGSTVGSWVEQTLYPVLFGTTQAGWAPIDLRFELLTGAVEPGRIARVYLVPFIGDACVVVGFEHRDWGPVGGGREAGESVRAALERELAEEAGGRLLTYAPFAVLRCHSRAPAPYRPHEPHPDYDCLYGYGEVELVGPPRIEDGPERTVAVEVVAPDAAVSLLAAKGRAWEADLYRLAANRRAADLTPGDAGSAWYSHRGTQPFERHREQLTL